MGRSQTDPSSLAPGRARTTADDLRRSVLRPQRHRHGHLSRDSGSVPDSRPDPHPGRGQPAERFGSEDGDTRWHPHQQPHPHPHPMLRHDIDAARMRTETLFKRLQRYDELEMLLEERRYAFSSGSGTGTGTGTGSGSGSGSETELGPLFRSGSPGCDASLDPGAGAELMYLESEVGALHRHWAYQDAVLEFCAAFDDLQMGMSSGGMGGAASASVSVSASALNGAAETGHSTAISMEEYRKALQPIVDEVEAAALPERA